MLAPNSGATEGERDNARSLLAKMEPEPVVTAAASMEPYDWDTVWNGMGVDLRAALHDAGILTAWDQDGNCVICRTRHWNRGAQ
jgi:hypothetical protein